MNLVESIFSCQVIALRLQNYRVVVSWEIRQHYN